MSSQVPQRPIYQPAKREKTVKPRKEVRRVSEKRKAERKTVQGMTDAEYVANIHLVPCQVCVFFGLEQTSPTEAHHPICGRYSTKRAPDSECMALCMCHHQGLMFDRDKTKLAIHQGKERWVERYGPDFTYSAPTRAAVAALLGQIDY